MLKTHKTRGINQSEEIPWWPLSIDRSNTWSSRMLAQVTQFEQNFGDFRGDFRRKF